MYNSPHGRGSLEPSRCASFRQYHPNVHYPVNGGLAKLGTFSNGHQEQFFPNDATSGDNLARDFSFNQDFDTSPSVISMDAGANQAF